MIRVFIPRIPGGTFLEVLRAEVDPRVALVAGPELPEVRDYEWLVEGVPTAEQLAASDRLRGVIIPWAGLQPRVRELLRAHPGLRVHNLHHNAAATAELAIALLLAAARRIVPLDGALRAGDWTPGEASDGDVLLAGKTAVVLGYGEIGRHVARTCRALGMEAVGVRRGGAAVLEGGSDAEVVGVERLDSVLPRAEVLIVTLPLTPETDGLLDAAALARLPDGAILVNVGRGPVVEEDALYEALVSGRIRAAGLDVWYRYPRGTDDPHDTLPASRPFHELGNVVLSPHRGGSTRETERLRASALAALLSMAARGEELPNAVDLERGY